MSELQHPPTISWRGGKTMLHAVRDSNPDADGWFTVCGLIASGAENEAKPKCPKCLVLLDVGQKPERVG